MNIETYFEEQKGITVDAARNARAKYTAIDMCRFAKNYHESEVENLDIQRVSQQSELLNDFLVKLRRLLKFTHSKPLPKYVEYYFKGIL